MDEKKLSELMKNEDFVMKMMESTNEEELKSLFSAHGMELKNEDIMVLGKIVAQAEKDGGELSEISLEKISGGINGAGGAAIGATAVATVSAAVYGAWFLYKKGVADGKKEMSDMWQKWKGGNGRCRYILH